MLHLAGFTDVRLQPQDERRLLEYGCGISAGVSRPTTRADEIGPAEFRAARPESEANMRRYGPSVIAILGKRAFFSMGDLVTAYGELQSAVLPHIHG